MFALFCAGVELPVPRFAVTPLNAG